VVEVLVVNNDLLKQQTEAIVNPWNRNIIPWWLLMPHGVSGAIKRKAGMQPFQELGKMGPLKLGSAVYTSAGRLQYKYIIHVVGINMLWRASESSIEDSVSNAMTLAETLNIKSLSFPVIGAGAGGMNSQRAEEIMLNKFAKTSSPLEVVLVRYSS
jgi:O-acetyl-ADP-ribose deacetylase (regulator of RNase III)